MCLFFFLFFPIPLSCIFDRCFSKQPSLLHPFYWREFGKFNVFQNIALPVHNHNCSFWTHHILFIIRDSNSVGFQVFSSIWNSNHADPLHIYKLHLTLCKKYSLKGIQNPTTTTKLHRTHSKAFLSFVVGREELFNLTDTIVIQGL